MAASLGAVLTKGAASEAVAMLQFGARRAARDQLYREGVAPALQEGLRDAAPAAAEAESAAEKAAAGGGGGAAAAGEAARAAVAAVVAATCLTDAPVESGAPEGTSNLELLEGVRLPPLKCRRDDSRLLITYTALHN